MWRDDGGWEKSSSSLPSSPSSSQSTVGVGNQSGWRSHSVGDPGCRGCVPSLSTRDVCMRSRSVAIATHTHTHTHIWIHMLPPSSRLLHLALLFPYEYMNRTDGVIWRCALMGARRRVCEMRGSPGFHAPLGTILILYGYVSCRTWWVIDLRG